MQNKQKYMPGVYGSSFRCSEPANPLTSFFFLCYLVWCHLDTQSKTKYSLDQHFSGLSASVQLLEKRVSPVCSKWEWCVAVCVWLYSLLHWFLWSPSFYVFTYVTWSFLSTHSCSDAFHFLSFQSFSLLKVHMCWFSCYFVQPLIDCLGPVVA